MIIQVKQGKLEGTVKKSLLNGNEYFAFTGIPYAKPPINELRFQAPVPIEKWDGVLDATNDCMPCSQPDIMTNTLIGDEDCLYLNVYTPELPSAVISPKAVMVFIHGGGFYSGSGSFQDKPADYLIDYDVVFVTLNYRLHALGFLNMGTKNALPNCGLRDQAQALKWINENIRQFGGDPQNVTIFGESAGASSVHYHILSPMSKGLFHKAILQSGTYNCSWSLGRDPRKQGFILAKKLGFDGENAEKAVEFLKTCSAKHISMAISEMHEDKKRNMPGKSESLSFVPSIEVDKENAFIPDEPHVMMKNADPVPLIVGLNDKEGRLAFIALGTNLMESLQQDFTIAVKHDLNCDAERIAVICKKIKEFYWKDKEIGPETKDTISDLYTDIMFKNFYESFENITNSQHPAYVYEFGFNGAFNMYSKIFMRDPTILTGAAHADELPYLFFKAKFFRPEFAEPELTVIKNMCSMWSNFAKTGNPTRNMNVEWRSSTTEKPCYLRIDKELKLVEGKVMAERIEFWKKLRAEEFV